MREFNDIKEENRNLLNDDEDISLIMSLVGHKCLVKENDCQHEYEKIAIAGFADGVIMFYRSGDPEPVYMDRASFYQIIMRMPDFGVNERDDERFAF